MRKISSLMLLAVILFSACKDNPTFKKGKDGLEYKIISSGSGSKIQYGNFMELNFATYYNTGTKDSLLNDSRTQGAPIIEVLDSISTPAAYFEILRQLRKGDSVAIRILTDSAFKKAPEQMPPFFKKGHYVLTTLKIVNVYKTKAEADKARAGAMVEMKKKDSLDVIAQASKDEKLLADYFEKNNIKPIKAPMGTYVVIIEPGAGINIDSNVVVKTNYTGRTLDGKMFDSNTDPSKGHLEPLNVNLTSNPALGNSVVPGWKDGLSLLKKGAKAKFYIPSALGFGKQGAGADIPPNAVLVFDIEVLDVLDKTRALAAEAEQNKKMEEMQKKYMDSLQKNNPGTPKK
ncbi:MAG: FKBP-type peptidyl-prolyl cis-trans isomerase [Ferruginibacter sp.]